jgi:4-hydroxythreonine-4-phosphate dehydrogenase
VGGETAFRQAFDGLFDGVVAMYHDQATIPMKVRCFGEAVNVTAGLPLIRTSVDHGTAYDIAASTQADASSMVEAIRLAARLVRAKRKMARA